MLRHEQRIAVICLCLAMLAGALIRAYKVSMPPENIYREGPKVMFSEGTPVNINTSEEDALCDLKGIGPKTAEKIVASRKTEGPFVTREDIMRIKGIGPEKYAKIKDRISV